MIAILWAILNISLFISFLYICIRAIKMVRREIGMGAAILFVIGLFSLGGNCNGSADQSENKLKQWKFSNDTLIQISHTQRVTLDKNPLFSIILFCSYGYDKKENQMIPVTASSHIAGLISGTKWIPERIFVTPDSSGSKLQYDVSGILEWQLLNTTVLYQSKNYTGVIDVGLSQ